jgi:hypothetical protein
MKSYDEVFDLMLGQDQVILLVEEMPGLVRVVVNTTWADPAQTHTMLLRVPEVKAKRFRWDKGVYGHEIQVPNGARRFCHPRLRSQIADEIALDGTLDLLTKTANMGFYWENWYDRLREAIVESMVEMSRSQRAPTWSFVCTRLQRAINQLMAGARGKKGLPLTDDAMIVRQMFEVELGYPNCLRDGELFEAIKHRFLVHVDNDCDITFVGKHDVGRHPMRVHPEDPKSYITRRPMTRFAMASWAMSPWANPIRAFREGRALPMCRDLVDPVPPPLRIEGFELPEVLKKKLTTVVAAICDIPDFNVYTADAVTANCFGVEEGDTSCLDAILVCPSGRRKLLAKETRSRVYTDDQFQAARERLEKIEGFTVDKTEELIEIMENGMPVYEYRYRYSHSRNLPCGRDKLKVQGGPKGIGKPIHQLYAQIGEELVPIDIIIAEKTVFAKGVRDMALGMLLPLAGFTVIDPTVSFEDLCRQAEEGLLARGLPPSGRFPIIRKRAVPYSSEGVMDTDTAEGLQSLGARIHWHVYQEVVGEAIVGPLPVARAAETEDRQSSHNTGVAINVEARMLVGVPFPYEERMAQEVGDTASFFMKHCGLK